MTDEVSPWPSSDGTLIVSTESPEGEDGVAEPVHILHVTETPDDYVVTSVGSGDTLAEALHAAADAAEEGKWDTPGREP